MVLLTRLLIANVKNPWVTIGISQVVRARTLLARNLISGWEAAECRVVQSWGVRLEYMFWAIRNSKDQTHHRSQCVVHSVSRFEPTRVVED